MSIPTRMPDMSGSERLRQWIEEYCASERHPALSRFSVHGPLTYNELWNPASPKFLERPGCYAIYGSGGELRYIGMSVTNVGSRIASHFSGPTQRAEFWANGPSATFVEVIEVINPWEAPSLEEYLITHARDVVYKVST